MRTGEIAFAAPVALLDHPWEATRPVIWLGTRFCRPCALDRHCHRFRGGLYTYMPEYQLTRAARS
jgi:hypothetical protein